MNLFTGAQIHARAGAARAMSHNDPYPRTGGSRTPSWRRVAATGTFHVSVQLIPTYIFGFPARHSSWRALDLSSTGSHQLPPHTPSPNPQMADTAELELAQFRSQWQQEVTEKARQQQQQPPPSIAAIPPAAAGPSRRRHSITYGATRPANFGHARTKSSVSHVDDTEDGDMPETLPGDKREDAWEGTIPAIPSHGREEQAPKSAMEHFEKAIEREDQGILGDSLNLYRKAYRVLMATADFCKS